MGGPGDPPGPSGHWADGRGRTLALEPGARKSSSAFPIPSGGSPPGPGQWPGLPAKMDTATSEFGFNQTLGVSFPAGRLGLATNGVATGHVLTGGVTEYGQRPVELSAVHRLDAGGQGPRGQHDLGFPNVSAMDLTLILQTLDSILSKISFAIRFMALFTVATGLVVLVGVILTGRYQRVRESILLRTLGASRKQVLRILLVEYAAPGFLAALTGTVLSAGASWALSFFVFDIRFSPPIWPLFVALTVLPALTVWTGLLMSRGILSRPPLEILRADG